jgi:hypothetical protein
VFIRSRTSSRTQLRHCSHLQHQHQYILIPTTKSPRHSSHDHAHDPIFAIKSSIVSQNHLRKGTLRLAIMSLTSLLAPFTVPLASLLAIPMLSSWSTSLNLVFLSLAWTTIAATYSPLQLETFAPLFIRLTLYIFPSLIFLLFDVGVPSLSSELKSQGQLGIATRQKGGRRKIWRVAGWSLANVVLTVAIQAAIEFLVTDVLRMRSLLQIKGSKWGLNHLPYPWTMIKHAIMGLLARNVSIVLLYSSISLAVVMSSRETRAV